MNLRLQYAKKKNREGEVGRNWMDLAVVQGDKERKEIFFLSKKRKWGRLLRSATACFTVGLFWGILRGVNATST